MKTQAIVVDRTYGANFKQRKKGKKTKDLNITSLIDILTILLVFMIKNVSMDSSQKDAPEGMLLPTTVNRNELIEDGQVVFVKLFPEKVLENGELFESKILFGKENINVGSLKDFSSNQQIRQSLLGFLKMEAKSIRNSGGVPCLLIQADEELKCSYITEFIKFSANASFINIYFSSIHTDNVDEVLGTSGY
ncbi:MAG: biopolymer transporter ExbD [Candidatus Cloacimonetes bacterium]|nr:biopolymer transporter ExbD [Candidatus Cloacimonadota bacterium]